MPPWSIYAVYIRAAGHSTDSKARRVMLSHIGDVIIMPLLDKSASDIWTALMTQHSKCMYRKLQLITELRAMNVGAHANLQSFFDRIDILPTFTYTFSSMWGRVYSTCRNALGMEREKKMIAICRNTR